MVVMFLRCLSSTAFAEIPLLGSYYDYYSLGDDPVMFKSLVSRKGACYLNPSSFIILLLKYALVLNLPAVAIVLSLLSFLNSLISLSFVCLFVASLGFPEILLSYYPPETD